MELEQGDFLRIPSGTEHELSTDEGDGGLQLVYFGIVLEANKGTQ